MGRTGVRGEREKMDKYPANNLRWQMSVLCQSNVADVDCLLGKDVISICGANGTIGFLDLKKIEHQKSSSYVLQFKCYDQKTRYKMVANITRPCTA